MDDSVFDFLYPESLRDTVIESVKFVAFLWVISQEIDEEFNDEMIRTIVLYNIAVIEALLLFRAKKKKIIFSSTKYSYPCLIPQKYQYAEKDIVLAFQEKNKKEDSQIWLHDLIMKQKSFLGMNLNNEITKLQSVRNTFHLSRTRQTLNFDMVERSSDIILKLIQKLEKE